ncbi:ATP-binding cassette domain-containing protein [Francisella sp. 19X1-34]|uniref:ATP-binding cassette domain-containing protein n=1 Tax=Francisella sp. 19X1-34 TaxID=3087177 RepID=UPI002E3559FF|nr:ATP-binding cassette domain-containing protein [Francisella sp. 19X1-34]MED7789674.1 ATP-binding cassette domain-containing protein [Francisella sp. 19X1-34]
MFTNSIQCLDLCYTIANTPISFKDVSLTFNSKKYGIVGDNGVGKSTLLKLLAKLTSADSGKVIASGETIYIPQILDSSLTIAETLNVSKILDAIDRINQGSIAEDDFTLAENNWDIKPNLEQKLKEIIGINIDLNQKISNFSGGQRTKILLAKIMLSKANILLLDEPTNNLDQNSKDKFIE